MKHKTRGQHSCGVLGCGTDQVWTLVLTRLREAGGSNWTDDLCQADIMAICVEATREYDRGK
jgi:hypothetical protein